MDQEFAIKTDGLGMTYHRRGASPVEALKGLSLRVPAGTVFGFLGPNGAGKTTTIRLLLGLLEPSVGTAHVLGYDSRTQGDDIRACTGALLEHTGLYEQLTASENLEFYGRAWRIPAAERQARIRELLTQMGLWNRRDERAGKLSRGMKQKLALARALFHRPELVLLDEPTAGLDVPAASAVRDDLQALVEREGVTVFLTTHNMAEAERLCGQVAVIREGALIATGHPDELRARSAAPRVELFGRGFTPERLAILRSRPEVLKAEARNGHLVVDLRESYQSAPLVALLVESGAEIEEVHRSTASLEEAFMALMEEER